MAGNTVLQPRLPSGDDIEKVKLSPITSPLLIVVDSTATIRLFPASIHPMEGFIVAIAIVGVGSAVLR